MLMENNCDMMLQSHVKRQYWYCRDRLKLFERLEGREGDGGARGWEVVKIRDGKRGGGDSAG